jgi:hypothetical protein
MFKQGDSIRDYVFPLALAEIDGNGYIFEHFLGTAFVIGTNGYALTATHCIEAIDQTKLVGMFVDQEENFWCVFRLEVCAVHPEEDVALLRFVEGDWKSIFTLSEEFLNSSFQYQSFGYPLDALYEELESKDIYGRVKPKPDLIFTSGYVKRRISFSVPSIKGSSLVEISAVAGEGCSGSPIFKVIPYRNWQIVGIYLGERTNDRGTNVAYALRNDGFMNWIPNGFERRLIEIKI